MEDMGTVPVVKVRSPGPSTSIAKRRLGLQLKAQRIKLGWSLQHAADALGDWGKNKVHKWETGDWRRAYVSELRTLLSVYGITEDEEAAPYLALMDQARHAAKRDAEHANVFRSAYPAFEQDAVVVSTYETSWVPGLLQSEAYFRVARAAQVDPLKPDDMEKRLTARRERQAVLEDAKRTFRFVFDEHALDPLAPHPDALKEQVEHIIDIASRPWVRVQVVPAAAGFHLAHGRSFTLLDYPDDHQLSVLYSESGLDHELIDAPAVIQTYRQMFTDACGVALSPAKTHDLLQQRIV